MPFQPEEFAMFPPEFIQQIHAAPCRTVLAITGGGSSAISELLAQPGASRTLWDAVVPYHSAALAELLGGTPEGNCTPRVARAMAMKSYQRAQHLRDTGDSDKTSIAGVGCTASLVSDRPKKGDHRAHVALQTHDATHCWSLRMVKDHRSRGEEEMLVTGLVLQAVATACKLDAELELELVENERVEHERVVAPVEWCKLLAGSLRATRQPSTRDATGATVALFPGAFHPRHAGHRRMAEIAGRLVSEEIAHELSIDNVDKPSLDFMEIEQRLAQFSTDEPVWLTRAATFAEKAVLFPGSLFVIGADTIVRIADPQYYGQDPRARDQAIAHIADQGCRFLVFGRVVSGEFQSASELKLPADLLAICQEVSEDEFRDDVSSTELRRNHLPPAEPVV